MHKGMLLYLIVTMINSHNDKISWVCVWTLRESLCGCVCNTELSLASLFFT